MLRNMFKKTYTKIDTIYRPKAGDSEEPSIPQGLWRKCNKMCIRDSGKGIDRT